MAFVDSSKDELSILAASVGEEVEHDVPGWRERLRLHRLELTVGTKQQQLLSCVAPPAFCCWHSLRFLVLVSSRSRTNRGLRSCLLVGERKRVPKQ